MSNIWQHTTRNRNVINERAYPSVQSSIQTKKQWFLKSSQWDRHHLLSHTKYHSRHPGRAWRDHEYLSQDSGWRSFLQVSVPLMRVHPLWDNRPTDLKLWGVLSQLILLLWWPVYSTTLPWDLRIETTEAHPRWCVEVQVNLRYKTNLEFRPHFCSPVGGLNWEIHPYRAF